VQGGLVPNINQIFGNIDFEWLSWSAFDAVKLG
jgi:hypothetical protein